VVGKKSYYGERQYYFDEPAATGYYRTGLTTALTMDGNLQADGRTTMAGTGAIVATALGMLSGEVSASETYAANPGYAVHLGYGFDAFDWYGYKAAFRMFGEYRSQDFRTVSSFLGSAPYNTATGASYTQQLPYDISAGLSASFSHLDKADDYSLQRPGDRWEVDLSLSKEIWSGLSGSLAVGYGRDQTTENTQGSIFNQNGFQVLGRLAWTPAAHTSVLSSYDSRAGVGEVSGTYTSENQGVGSWTATAQAQTAPNDQSGAGGAVTYSGNRGDVTLAHSAGLTGIGYDGISNVGSSQQRSTASVATSFVFADGAWGFGRPVTNGFAIVTPHPSLNGSRVIVGQADAPVAQTDWLGSAVVPSLTPYRTSRLPFDAPEAPTGYDLGSATYDIHAAYKAGYALQAGSAYTVTAMGTLQTASGEPIPLLAGTAREQNKPNGRKVELFTNRAGRFGAQGLAPGRWVIEMPTEGEPTRYAIDIPDGVKGLHNAGVLKPASGLKQIVEAANGR
jgi:outer membrane usher protein